MLLPETVIFKVSVCAPQLEPASKGAAANTPASLPLTAALCFYDPEIWAERRILCKLQIVGSHSEKREA